MGHYTLGTSPDLDAPSFPDVVDTGSSDAFITKQVVITHTASLFEDASLLCVIESDKRKGQMQRLAPEAFATHMAGSNLHDIDEEHDAIHYDVLSEDVAQQFGQDCEVGIAINAELGYATVALAAVEGLEELTTSDAHASSSSSGGQHTSELTGNVRYSSEEAALACEMHSSGRLTCLFLPWGALGIIGILSSWSLERPPENIRVSMHCLIHKCKCSVAAAISTATHDMFARWLLKADLPAQGASQVDHKELARRHREAWQDLRREG